MSIKRQTYHGVIIDDAVMPKILHAVTKETMFSDKQIILCGAIPEMSPTNWTLFRVKVNCQACLFRIALSEIAEGTS